MKKYIYIVFLMISTLAHAQSRYTVTGTVTDSKGEPVIGAAVMLQGTSSGVVTDIDGHYEFTFDQPRERKSIELVFSCMSYESETVNYDGRKIINMVLKENSELLDEVVVVGYGSMRRSDLTGSVTSVKINETEAGQSAAVSSMLQGRVAGVQVTSNSASPDAGVSILVRGASSFNGNSEPLYVVDGIVMNTSGSVSLMSGNLGDDNKNTDESTNGLMGINPLDIASIEVLKDASATAIYGSQGANGVVIITTKKANKDKPVITANLGIDISTPYKKQEMMNFDEYSNYLQAVYESDIVRGYNPTLSDAAKIRLNALRSDTFRDKYEPIDWQDYMMRNAVSQRYYFSIAGQPKQTNYLFSFGYNNTKGICQNTGFQNFTIRLNLEHKFGNKVTLGTKTSFSYLDSQLTQGASTGKLTAATSLMRSMLTCPPYSQIISTDDDGDVIDWGDDENRQYGPNRWLQGFVNNKVEYRINPSVYLQVRILPWLSFKSTFGGDFRVTEQSKFKSRLLTSDSTGSTAAIAHIDRLAWNWDSFLSVWKKFKKKHTVQGTLGMTMSMNNNILQTTEGANIDEWKAKEQSINAAAYTYFTYKEDSSSLMSYYLRGIYNYDERYVLTTTVRADGSSKFAKGHRWGVFPSMAFAWRMNQEKWFKAPSVSMMKFRISWGQVGNQAVSSYSTIYNYTTSYYADHGNIESQKTLTTTSNNLPNADLKWETTEQTNIGLDFGMFQGRIALTVDAYYKLTKDLLQTKTLAGSAGMSNPYVNMGSIENKGLEFTLNTVPVKTRNWEWMLGGNLSLNRNKIISINPEGTDKDWIYLSPGNRQYVNFFRGDDIGNGSILKSQVNMFIEGEAMGLFYGIPTNGLVQEGKEGVPFSSSDKSYRGPGSVDYIDVNGDGYITEEDRVIIGDPNPDFTYGFNTSLRYKNVSLTANFVGSHGNDIYNVNKMIDTNTSGVNQNLQSASVSKAYTSENTATWYPAIGGLSGTDVKWASDRYVEDGSYLRLANLTLGYDIPIRKKKAVIRNISISATGSNLFIWTRYSGWDPDVNSYGSIKKKGVDMGSYPGARAFKFDIKLTF